MSGNDSTSKNNPFMKKGSPKTSGNNPFTTKMVNEDASEGVKREFFEAKREFAERKQETENDKD
ncbi:hypothetical protein [Paenibacillus glucanolyticus]|uniref:hypothetical protein n=1 Tax=Paenibacillus glucanolyticus TaxID=59843 RepID=UPI0030D4E800